MKKILGVLAAALITFIASVESAQAREGSIKISNADLACEGVSIWRESAYKITGRCQGLVYPYDTRSDHYALWARLDNGNAVRIDDIERGYFEGNATDSFTDIYITAESTSSPRRPSATRVVAGVVEPFSFDTSKTTTVTASPAATPRATNAPNGSTAQTGATVGSVIGRIARALLIIVGVIIIVAVIASLLFRRRGSVSA